MCLEHIYGRVCVLSIIYDSVSRGNAAPVFEGLWSHAGRVTTPNPDFVSCRFTGSADEVASHNDISTEML